MCRYSFFLKSWHDSERKNFVRFSANDLIAKLRRLDCGKYYTVPGVPCKGCPVVACPFNEPNRWPARPIVKMSDPDFQLDLTMFSENLPIVAEKTATLVIEELRNQSESADSRAVHGLSNTSLEDRNGTSTLSRPKLPIPKFTATKPS